MVKHTQTIRRQKPTNCFSVFDHFVVLALKGLTYFLKLLVNQITSFFHQHYFQMEQVDKEIDQQESKRMRLFASYECMGLFCMSIYEH